MLGVGDEGIGAGQGQEVADLVVARPVAETDDGETRALGGDERHVDRDAVGEQDRHPRAAGAARSRPAPAPAGWRRSS